MRPDLKLGAFLFVLLLPLAVLAQESGQQLQGFNLEGYSENGEKAWDVKGVSASIRGEQIEIANVDANHYGDQTVNLTAQRGMIDKESGNIQLEKDVVITSATGSQIKTDSLNWEKSQDTVSTADPVTLTDKNMTATGTGLTAHPGEQTAKMEKDVNVQVRVEPAKDPGKLLTITCDGPMEVDQKRNVATFSKNVVAVQEDKTLKADKAEIYFDADQKKIKQLVCLGNVEIVQGENKTYAEKAVYSAEEQKITLFGKPKLILQTEGDGGLSGLGKP